MGPLALLDLIGLDVSLSALEILQGELGGLRTGRPRCCAGQPALAQQIEATGRR
jgi:3-hydroxyacyl-CoA dehydrogenase